MMTAPRFRLTTAAVPAALMLGLAVLQGLAIKRLDRIRERSQLLAHSQAVVATVHELAGGLRKAESSILRPTAVDDAAAALLRSQENSRRLIARLKDLTANNPAQSAALGMLDYELERRFAALDAAIESRPSPGIQLEPAQRSPDLRRGLAHDVDSLLDQVESEEDSLLVQRNADYYSLVARSEIFLWVSGLLQFILSGVALWLVRRQLRRFADSRLFLQATLDSLDQEVAIVDEHGKIVAVNETWQQFGRENNWQASSSGVGANYLTVCDRSRWAGSKDGAIVADGLRSMLGGGRARFQLEYPCHGANASVGTR